jgi:peptidoglycan/xylan/chitin deacetylase (PgdA/CDA1 family)
MLRATGVFAAASRLRRRDSLLILCYHGISLDDEHLWEGGLYITPAVFRRRLELLRNLDANILPLGEGLERLHTGTLPPRSVAITFDDGFYDFYLHAYPALKEFGFPCTLYLTTYYCDHQEPIPNLMLSYLLWKARRPRDSQQPENLGSFAESLGIDYQSLVDRRIFQIMSPEEVTEVARGGIDIELHTHRHRTPSDRDLFIREIRDNARRIEELTGRAPEHFCYPSGVVSPLFLPWLKECGVRSATTCQHGLATSSSDPLLLPRFLDGSGTDELDFESWLSGVR